MSPWRKQILEPLRNRLAFKKKEKKRCSSVTPLLQITIASPFGQDWKRCRIILGMEESSEYPKYPIRNQTTLRPRASEPRSTPMALPDLTAGSRILSASSLCYSEADMAYEAKSSQRPWRGRSRDAREHRAPTVPGGEAVPPPSIAAACSAPHPRVSSGGDGAAGDGHAVAVTTEKMGK